jgi:hypothetical protein
MAATDNITITGQRPDLSKPRPPATIAASTEIFAGSFVAADGSGDAVPAPATGALTFLGVAKNYYNNTGAATTTKVIEFEPVEILKYAVTGAAVTNIGAKVYYTDDDALSMTIVGGTGVAGSQVGRLHGLHEDGTPLVDLSKNEF